MRTARLLVRRFRLEDFDALAALLTDAEVMRFLEPPFSQEQSAAFLERAGLAEPPLVYAVEDGNGLAGYVIWHPWDDNAQELGFVLRREVWGHGYAQELTEAFTRTAAQEEKAVVLECAPGQAATKRLALRNGFRYEGRFDGLDLYRKDV